MNRDNYIEIFTAAFNKLFIESSYHSPNWFWAFSIIPIIIAYYILKNSNDQVDVKFSSSEGFQEDRLFKYLQHIPFVLVNLAIIAFIIALARPQDAKSWEQTKTQGIDMVLSMDISTSMNAPDFKPDRLEASKKIATNFILDRPNDRFGLVVFAGESFTQCPLTIDHDRIVELFKDIRTGILEDGTAIGSGLATAVQRLKDSDAKSKVIILLTDGENNAGSISPKTAAELASTFDIKVYTIGIGKSVYTIDRKTFFGTQQQQVKSNIDHEALNNIAKVTGGKYYRAESAETLKNIYEEIDRLEKTELASLKFYKKTDLHLPYLLIGIGFLLISKALGLTIFKTIG